MSEPLFNIVFFGIVQTGKDRDTAIENMAKLFHTDIDRIKPYFSGGRKVIKANVDTLTAEKYITVLENAGLVVKQEGAVDNTDHNHVKTSANSGNTDHIAQNDTATTTPASGVSLAPPGVDIIENPMPIIPQKIADFSSITMADTGVDIIEHPKEKSAAPIADFSKLTLAEKEP